MQSGKMFYIIIKKEILATEIKFWQNVKTVQKNLVFPHMVFKAYSENCFDMSVVGHGILCFLISIQVESYQ